MSANNAPWRSTALAVKDPQAPTRQIPRCPDQTHPRFVEHILNPGERVALTAGHATAVQPATVEHSIAWLSGKLMFNDEPLEYAVKEANRYSTAQIRLDDDKLRNLRISGVFRAGDSEQFVHAVTTYFSMQMRRDAIGNYVLASHSD